MDSFPDHDATTTMGWTGSSDGRTRLTDDEMRRLGAGADELNDVDVPHMAHDVDCAPSIAKRSIRLNH
eukprot:178572-Rhodomonas_salina.2